MDASLKRQTVDNNIKISPKNKKKSLSETIKADFKQNKFVILMSLPVVIWYVVFHYIPLYGITIAFKNYSPMKGIFDSQWVGLRYFREFFNSYYAWRVIRNTFLINIYQLAFGFPAPIILAVLLNEVRSSAFKRSVQTITYLPHFISLVVICGMIVDFTAKDGVINAILQLVGWTPTNLLLKPEYFRTIYVSSGIWKGVGWGSIIYLASLSGIDTEQYEAATIDGANRWKQFLNVTLPGIAPTIIILLILQIGHLMSEGADKIILLYNANTYETADIISSFVYRRGLIDSNFSYSTAVGLFNSVINMVLLITANKISRKVNETSLW